ncbi:MAG TPA: hypothetical protein DSN98_06185 [Thermoplasmata archaeon]|nr:MAG TPA: hypothetical protein DSN98_06185 [Thermoplasmata archaeon]
MDIFPLSRKCLAIGIILLFVGVTIASTINFQVVKASTDDDLVEVTKESYYNLQYFNDNETNRHPILLALVVLIFWSRLIRVDWLWEHATICIGSNEYVIHPLLLLRGNWLMGSTIIWVNFLMNLSDIFGWNWDVEDFLNPWQSNK